jgi:membrane protease YdiL (CAAX protease family)
MLSQQIFRHFPNTTPNPVLPLLTADNGLVGRLLIFAMISVGAPFFEELFFRGALFGALRARFPWVASAVISAILFAIVHPPVNWLPIFGLGFGMATMREMRQSLVPSIVAHFLQNTASFVFLSLLFGGGSSGG